MSIEKSFTLQGIWYASVIGASEDIGCDNVHLGDAINWTPESKWGVSIEKYMENRMLPRNKNQFMKSKHYQAVVAKFGQYPPPPEIPILVLD